MLHAVFTIARQRDDRPIQNGNNGGFSTGPLGFAARAFALRAARWCTLAHSATDPPTYLESC